MALVKFNKSANKQAAAAASSDNTVPSTVPCDMTVKYKLSYTEESQKLFDNVSATQVQNFNSSQQAQARANIGITEELWNKILSL